MEYERSAPIENEPAGDDIFDPEKFEELRKGLGIDLPFEIRKRESYGDSGKKVYGYDLVLPVVSGYYTHIDDTGDIIEVSQDLQRGGQNGLPITDSSSFGVEELWRQQYGADKYADSREVLVKAVSMMEAVENTVSVSEAIAQSGSYQDLVDLKERHRVYRKLDRVLGTNLTHDDGEIEKTIYQCGVDVLQKVESQFDGVLKEMESQLGDPEEYPTLSIPHSNHPVTVMLAVAKVNEDGPKLDKEIAFDQDGFHLISRL